LRGFVSVINLKLSPETKDVQSLLRVFNGLTAELEITIFDKDYDTKLVNLVSAHSDVNIGKVFFFTNDLAEVEQQITNVRIFGIQPGIIVTKENFKNIGVINKFEYGVINAIDNENYLEIYKTVKENDFKGTLLLDFGNVKIPMEMLQNESINGVYINVTDNPAIKDTISTYRRIANSIY